MLIWLPVGGISQPGAEWWQPSSARGIDPAQWVQPTRQQAIYQLNLPALSNWLGQAPEEFDPRGQALTITLPNPEGALQQFQVMRTHVLAPDLGARFPSIMTWVGQGVDDPQATIRCDVTEQGFHAIILGSEGIQFIEPLTLQTTAHYQVYRYREVIRQESLGCGVDEHLLEQAEGLLPAWDTDSDSDPDHSQRQDEPEDFESGDQLYTYNLAVSCDFRYCNSVTAGNPNVSGALSALTTTINQVNAIYERDLTIRFQLNSNNDQLMFINQSTDPFALSGSTGDPSTMITENPQVIDSRIGIGSYDIGHTFTSINSSTAGAAGVGYFFSVCATGSGQSLGNPHKANGASAGQTLPAGAQFLETVTHEFGHQFNGRHSFNTNDPQCNGPRDPTRPFEPASGSTIMSYAGLCGLNLQQSSDLYFNAGSYETMHNFSRTGTPCVGLSNTGNTAPVIDPGFTGTAIPKETPFELIAVATDAEDMNLTYCWEQADIGPAGNPDNPVGNAPIFRSFPPSTSPIRIFPRLNSILNGTTIFGETYPTYARDLTFRVTVRDNHPGAGGVSYEEVQFDVSNTAGPFLVDFPNGAETLTAGGVTEIIWDPANTDANPVNCATVDIYLSTDGGFNYPTLLASQVPNDGSERVFMPDLPGNNNRIKIKASENIFFDLSDDNFTIEAGAFPDLALLLEREEIVICPSAVATFELYSSGIGGFAGAFNLQASGLPSGISLSSVPAQPEAGDTVLVTLTADDTISQGLLSFVLFASAPGVSESLILNLRIDEGLPAAPNIAAPLNGAFDQASRPNLAWQNIPNATGYRFELSDDPSFSTLLESSDQIGTNYQVVDPLDAQGVYFWRVAAISDCGQGAFSRLGAIQVGNCESFLPTDLPQTIPPFGSPAVVSSSVSVTNPNTISSLAVRNLQGTHDNVNELTFTLRKSGGGSATLISRPCALGAENFNLSFADLPQAVFPPCPPTDGGTYQPSEPLSVFAGGPASGNYSLRIIDSVNFGDGQLDNWELEMCFEGGDPLTVGVNDTLYLLRGEEKTIDNALLQVNSNSSAASAVTYTLSSLPAYGSLKRDGIELGLGEVFTQADIDNGLISYAQDGSQQAFDAFTYSTLDQNNGWSGLQRFNIRVTDVVSIAQASVEPLRIFPNPTDGKLTVALPDGLREAHVSLFNQQGEQLQQRQVRGEQALSLSLGQYPAGLYLLRVRAQGRTWAEKVQVK